MVKPFDTKTESWKTNILRTFENMVTITKLCVVIVIIGIYALDYAGYLKEWNSSCYNDLALHNYRCTLATQKCFDRLRSTSNIFYCTPADFLAKNNKFCNTGVCDKKAKHCEDNGFTDRVTEFSQKFRDCMYEGKFL